MNKKLSLAVAAASLLYLSGCSDPNEITSSGFTNKEFDEVIDQGAFPDRKPNGVELPKSVVDQRVKDRRTAATSLDIESDKQILFGDTHVHTTYSGDAFAMALPMAHGSRGAMPPSDACDYARYISQIDFFFITDHAKSLNPKTWNATKEAVRLCNEIAGDKDNQDVVAFTGFEWTQVGSTSDNHYGHHNVLFRDTGEDQLPTRPIAAKSLRKMKGFDSVGAKVPLALRLIDYKHNDYYTEFNDMVDITMSMEKCDTSIHPRELPENCFEQVDTPTQLIDRLDQWGFDTMVFPHGTAWGNTAPPAVTWRKQLDRKAVDNVKTPMIEVYSGHGNSEEYANFNERPLDKNGNPYCPEPQPNYLPMCWQAGEIIRKRCLDEDRAASECDLMAKDARQKSVDSPTHFGWLAVQGSTEHDWLDSGQARDMFLPAFNYRPLKSVQAGLAMRNVEDKENPIGFHWGFIGSTDTHSAKAGHGFKQVDRLSSMDVSGASSPMMHKLMSLEKPKKKTEPQIVTDNLALEIGLAARETERMTSFMTLGGIAAVHSEGRSREAIWDAMKRREVYGTSGPRMLLWFDMLKGDKKIPMGAKVNSNENPKFRVSAMGAFKQLPGCPDYVKKELSEKELHRLAGGECYNPSDERLRITRIEVIRIRPQIEEGEDISQLIEDTWKVIECPKDQDGCTVEFEDEEYAELGRDTTYYVRAIQEPTATVNGANLRTEFDDEGNPVSINPCYGSYHTPADDQCLAEAEHRAWSSPIYLTF